MDTCQPGPGTPLIFLYKCARHTPGYDEPLTEWSRFFIYEVLSAGHYLLLKESQVAQMRA